MSELLQQVSAALPDPLAPRIGVAVSGGGDSIALLVLLQRLSVQKSFTLSCVTVDHGLRPDAASEAAAVGQLCKRLDVPHQTLLWQGWDGTGNTQNAARKARYCLMADWAHSKDISTLALGHTQDDQAETVVMRLARGAGVDGLSAMSPLRKQHGITWIRPMLGITRADLRSFLQAEGVAWCEDPTNQDTGFERIKIRRTLEALAPLGIEQATLAQVASNMASARIALEDQTLAAAREIATPRAGGVRIDFEPFDNLSEEIARRLLVAAIRWVNGSVYAPRYRSVAGALTVLRQKGRTTLGGCCLQRKGASLWVFRELHAVRDQCADPGALWDGRWIVSGPDAKGKSVAALGENGLSQCPDWRTTSLPRGLLLASPAIWQGDQLHAAPLAGNPCEWHAVLQKGETSFFESLISH